MIRALARWAGFVIPAAIALVLTHHVIYLLRDDAVPLNLATSASGHEGYWPGLWAIVFAAGLALIALAAHRIRRFSTAAGHKDGIHPGGHFGRYIRMAARWWIRLAITVTLLYVVQENAEYLRVGGGLPGLDVLWAGDHALALLAVGAVCLLVSIVVALGDLCRSAILVKLRQSRASRVRSAPAARTRSAVDIETRATLLAFTSAGRAPPLLA